MSTYAADFARVPQGLELTDEDLLANRAGLLSRAQRENLERESRYFFASAAGTSSLTALAVAGLALGRLGSATLILLGIGVTTLFLLLARECRCALWAIFPSVQCAEGCLILQESSGLSQEILVGESAFFVSQHVAEQLQAGGEYELYYVAKTLTLLGWRRCR